MTPELVNAIGMNVLLVVIWGGVMTVMVVAVWRSPPKR